MNKHEVALLFTGDN